MEKNILIEKESLRDLERIVSESGSWGLRLVLIGGYAVRAYTRGYRYTKDIDFIAKEKTGELTGLLKSLGYGVREKDFMLAGKKRLNGGFVDMHISVGDVFDVSTNTRYPITDQVFDDSQVLDISGYHDEARKIKVKAPVVSLEDLMILKLMTRGRDKDEVDLISLLTDRWGDLDPAKMAGKCRGAGLSKHIREGALNLMALIRSGRARKTWLSWTGQALMRKTETELIRHLRQMEETLTK